jgi:hypothetical protein
MAKNPMTIDALQRMLQASIEKVGGGKNGQTPPEQRRQQRLMGNDPDLPFQKPAGRYDEEILSQQRDTRQPYMSPPEQRRQRRLMGDDPDLPFQKPAGRYDIESEDPYWTQPYMSPAEKRRQQRLRGQEVDFSTRERLDELVDRGAPLSEMYDPFGNYRDDFVGGDSYWEADDVGEIDWEGMRRRGEEVYRTGRRSARDAYDKELVKRKAIARGDWEYLKSLGDKEGAARKRVVSGAQQRMAQADKIATQNIQRMRKEGRELGTAQRGSQYLGLQKGALHGTLPQSTGALNGVMRGLAGLFILFVFISVFYMVFGPLYSVLTTNFLSIIAADGSTMLGGKDVTTLYANTANSILLWVPLLVIGGTLYLLISMVFERESKGLARTNEMLAWDALAGSDEDVNLDIALEGGFDPMGDFYGPS